MKTPVVANLHELPAHLLRTFCIIAHVDHGKSTLADRLLELTGNKALQLNNINSSPSLDNLPVERARGITVKTQTASMPYRGFLLNLMDTPGHVDFSGEVGRAMAACQGALLVVDGGKGIQAQTLVNLERAKREGMAIIPIVNKIDLNSARIEEVCVEVGKLCGVADHEDILKVSAKSGLNCGQILERIVSRIPPPTPDMQLGTFSSIILDSWYDEYRGVICLISVQSGTVKAGDSMFLGSAPMSVIEVGHLTPSPVVRPFLGPGHLGYLVTGIKSMRGVAVGECISAQHGKNSRVIIQTPKPTVFAGLFPKFNNDYQLLSKALDKLSLNDVSVTIEKAHSAVLGAGWKLGFLGSLHMEVFRERLAGEFKAETIVTAPNVGFRIVMKDTAAVMCNSPAQFPEPANKIKHIEEPVCLVTVFTAPEFIGPIMQLLGDHRGVDIQMDHVTASRVKLTSAVPLVELIGNFHDQLLSICAGFCSFDYELAGYRQADIVNVQILINSEPADMLSFLTHASKARSQSLALLKKLKENIDRQQFEVVLQAAVSGRVVARDGLSALRKDVTAKCYGGDGSRKRKLLEKQKEGKEKLRRIGRVSIDSDALSKLMQK